MDEAAAWSILPQDEHKSVWNQTEENFWSDFQRKQDIEEAEADSEHRRAEAEIRTDLRNAEESCRQLYHEQQRLAAQLSNVEAELASRTHSCNQKKEQLIELDVASQKKRAERLKTRDQVRGAMNQFFKGKRHGAEQEPNSRPQSRSQQLAPMRPPDREVYPIHTGGKNGYTDRHPYVVDTKAGPSTPPTGRAWPTTAESSHALTHIADADGNRIGPVLRTAPWNQWVHVILQLPVLRDVKIRRGRKFTAENLQGIYDRTEAKGVKWLACMIQATGAVQTTRCQSCEKSQGAFEQCVIVGGDLFQKCGNCEWNRQGCHGASGEVPPLDSPRRRILDEEGRREESTKARGTGVERIPSIYAMAYGRESDERQQQQQRAEHWSDREHRERDGLDRARERVAQAHSLTAKNAMEHAYAYAKAQVVASREDATTQASSSMTQRALHEHQSIAPASAPPSHHQQQPPQILPSLAQLGHAAPRHPPLAEFNSHNTSTTTTTTTTATNNNNNNKSGWAANANGSRILLPEPTRVSALIESKPYQTPYPATGGFTPTNGFPVSQGFTSSASGPSPRFSHVYPAHPHGAFTAVNPRGRRSSQEMLTPLNRSAETSPRLHDNEAAEYLDEITQDNLILRDNGVVYTHPECMEGVPLVKIDETHPYWEPHWRNVTEIIEPALESWKVKYKAASEAEARGEKGGSSKYQIGRQVNRGKSILQFLDDGPLSPYQLLAKRYMTSGKGGITSYDTLFRLSDSIEQLSKFNLGIRPVDWLRHRLYEIMQEEGPEFNLSRTVHDFYRDPKLAFLRKKHGMKDIGRPSGRNRESGSRPSLGGTKKDTPQTDSKKRKSMHQDSPYGSPVQARSPLAPRVAFKREEEEVGASREGAQDTKRTKMSGSPHLAEQDDFDYRDVSDTDSLSEAPLTADDFRICQVKTRLYTSSAKATQYWKWRADERRLEHQLLRREDPVKWSGHKEPANFHVWLSEVGEVSWNLGALRVHLSQRPWGGRLLRQHDGYPRGDVMVAFKREKTMKRFLRLCKDQGLRLDRVTEEEMDKRWNGMASGPPPDEEATEDGDKIIKD